MSDLIDDEDTPEVEHLEPLRRAIGERYLTYAPVSYTHLTLPTILLV